MRIYHITGDTAEASGVWTFVRRIDGELKGLGVESRIITRAEELPERVEEGETIFHIHGMWLGLHHRAAKRAQKLGVKVVWSTHGMTSPWAMRHKRWKKILAWKLYQEADLRRAAVVHCTTELEAKWNKALGFENTAVVALGTERREKSGERRAEGGERRAEGGERRAESGERRAGGRTLLFVGRVYPVKALDRLITAFQMVPHEGWRLRIVGPDEAGHMGELKRIAGGEVDFVGSKFGAELEREYAACDALALVSHTENFGATVVDAMAHGKPVVTSTNTPWEGVRGRCGWWVENEPRELGKALKEMMAMSDEERGELGERGRRWVEAEFSWGAVAREILGVYEGIEGKG